MEDNKQIDTLLDEATEAIAASPDDTALYLSRAKLYYRAQRWGDAMNDVLKTLELDPGNAEARTYRMMIDEILAYRYTDYYNP